MARKSLASRIRRYTFPELPGHYMQPAKKRDPPMTVNEAGKLRWKGTTPEERSEHMRDIALKRWYPNDKKKDKKTP